MPKLADYPLLATGKVRQLHVVDDAHLLLVASDRISAFDFVLSTEIPDKGRVLTAMSVFWFELLADVVPNQLVSHDDPRIPDEVRGRALLVKRLDMLPIECVARGFLAGSGTRDYQRTGQICGVELPAGLVEASRLPEPIFTPASKAEIGDHDENIDFAAVVAKVGKARADELREVTLAVYRKAEEYAEARGLILADTKLEFGLDGDTLVLGDEVLTPDSSRFWPADEYTPGRVQHAFDKQYVREYLTDPATGWDRTGNNPPPALPAELVAATRARYVEAYERLSGRSLADWPTPTV